MDRNAREKSQKALDFSAATLHQLRMQPRE